MSNYPEQVDVFADKASGDAISSSDPNAAYDGIEATQGLIGALGKPQTWSTTLLTTLRKYKRGMSVVVSGGAPVVRAGEIVLENTDGSRLVFRRNTADVTLSAANIDVGTLVATTYYIYAKGGTAATTSPIVFSTDINAPSGVGTAPFALIGWFYNASTGSLASSYGGNYGESSQSTVRQVADYSTGVFGSAGTSELIPKDNTKPQSSEGREFMHLYFTPRKSGNKLIINVVVNWTGGAAGFGTAALFTNESADAIAATCQYQGGGDWNGQLVINHVMIAQSTNTLRFSVNCGMDASDYFYFNGYNTAAYYGGAYISSIIITEIEQ